MKMKNEEKILVGYATRYGSTRDVAEIIGDQLSGLGYDFKVSGLMEKIDLSDIDAVFLGSPLHLGKWLPEAREFVQSRKNELNRIPVITFTTGITIAEPSEHNLLKAKFAIDDISQYIIPFDSGFFAGRISRDLLNESDLQLIKMAKILDGDYIDPEKIKEWVTETCNNLKEEIDKQKRL